MPRDGAAEVRRVPGRVIADRGMTSAATIAGLEQRGRAIAVRELRTWSVTKFSAAWSRSTSEAASTGTARRPSTATGIAAPKEELPQAK
jgi:hypothetical protein